MNETGIGMNGGGAAAYRIRQQIDLMKGRKKGSVLTCEMIGSRSSGEQDIGGWRARQEGGGKGM